MAQQPRLDVRELRESLWLIETYGEHDLASNDLLVAALDQVARTGTTVVVDFSEAIFIDSSVIRTLVEQAHGRPDERDDWIAVVAREGTEPRRLFDLVNAQAFLRVFDSREAALTAVAPLEHQARE